MRYFYEMDFNPAPVHYTYSIWERLETMYKGTHETRPLCSVKDEADAKLIVNALNSQAEVR